MSADGYDWAAINGPAERSDPVRLEVLMVSLGVAPRLAGRLVGETPRPMLLAYLAMYRDKLAGSGDVTAGWLVNAIRQRWRLPSSRNAPVSATTPTISPTTSPTVSPTPVRPVRVRPADPFVAEIERLALLALQDRAALVAECDRFLLAQPEWRGVAEALPVDGKRLLSLVAEFNVDGRVAGPVIGSAGDAKPAGGFRVPIRTCDRAKPLDPYAEVQRLK